MTTGGGSPTCVWKRSPFPPKCQLPLLTKFIPRERFSLAVPIKLSNLIGEAEDCRLVILHVNDPFRSVVGKMLNRAIVMKNRPIYSVGATNNIYRLFFIVRNHKKATTRNQLTAKVALLVVHLYC